MKKETELHVFFQDSPEENGSKKREEVSKAYHQEVFKNREQEVVHSKYAKEKMINSYIAGGNVERLQEVFSNAKTNEVGNMSHNPFRQQLYAVVVGIAIATRAAMDGGMLEEEAYTLSDIYIQKADACVSSEDLWRLYTSMVLDFAARVDENKKKKRTKISANVQAAMDYILRHLHYELSLGDIAKQANLSETYFSALFKKETGDTVSEFIQKSRVEEAKSMLRFSDYSLTEISQYLGFCSQSHFAQTFKKFEKTTPGQYRKANFKSSW